MCHINIKCRYRHGNVKRVNIVCIPTMQREAMLNSISNYVLIIKEIEITKLEQHYYIIIGF